MLGQYAFSRASSLPLESNFLPRRSLEVQTPFTRRVSLDVSTHAAGLDAFGTYSPAARMERAGVCLEVGRSVNIQEQRQLLERNWNTEEYISRDRDEVGITSPVISEADSSDMERPVQPRHRLEQRWSLQSSQASLENGRRPVGKRALRSSFQSRRARLKSRKSFRTFDGSRTAALSTSASKKNFESAEEADRQYLEIMKSELEQKRARHARLSDSDAIGGLDSYANVGLLNRDSENRLGSIVQLGLAAEAILESQQQSSSIELQNTTLPLDSDVPAETLKARVQNKEAAHYLLVQFNLRLLGRVAQQYRGRGMDIEDLIIEGTHGLNRAIEGFDPSKGNRFSTYAYMWIRQAVGRCISEHSRVVRLPAHVFEAMGRILKAKAILSERTNGTVSDEQIARAVGLSEEKVSTYLSAAQTPRSFDDPLKSSHSRADQEIEQNLGDVIEDEQPSADDMLVQEAQTQLMKQDIDTVLNGLSLRERNILRYKYGLHSEALSLTDLSQAYGVSKERIRQIGEIALAKLQKRQLTNGEDLNNGKKEKMPFLKPAQYTNDV